MYTFHKTRFGGRQCIVACFLILFFLNRPGNLRASTLSLTAESLSDYTASLSYRKRAGYSPAQLSLLNHKLLGQGRFSESSLLLTRLERTAARSVRPIVAVERIKLYLKKKEPQKLLDFLADLANSAEASLYEEKIYSTLQENFTQFADSSALQRMTSLLIQKLDGWRDEPELISWMLQFAKPDEELFSKLAINLWAVMDLEEFPSAYNREIEIVKRHPAAYQSEIATHFSTQYFKRNWTYIIEKAPDFLSRMTPGSQEFLRVRDIWFHTYFRKRRYADLINILQIPENLQTLSLTPKKQAHLLFRLWLKKGYIAKARKQLRRLEKFPDYENLAARYFELAEFYFDRDRFIESLPYYSKITSDNAPGSLVQIVQWRKLWAHYRLKQPKQMREIISWADGYKFDSREVAAKFCFWGVKLNLSKHRRVLSCYHEFPLTYYGFRALQEYGNYPGIEKTILTPSTPVPVRRLSKAETDFLELVHVYYLTGETDFTDELVMNYMKQQADQYFFLQLADVLSRDRRFYLQQLLIELYFKNDLDNIRSPRHPLLSAYYPAAYRSSVSRYVSKSNVPRHLALAVMREESNFRPDIESPAGAVGLMQLMPSTARYVAKTIRSRFDPSLLSQPDFNVKLGVAYLKRLMRRYKGNLHYTLAAYNGGATNVKRWRKKAHSNDLDVFVETITYIETQNYVKRVLRSYHIYQLLHGERHALGYFRLHDTGAGRMPDNPS